jgi:hypothetical protein
MSFLLMRSAYFAYLLTTSFVVFATSIASAEPLFETDFSKGDLTSLGWKTKGDWDIFSYPKESANNPGPVARFAANKPDGALTKAFAEIKNPRKLTLTLQYGWGWGDASQGSDSASWMLLNAKSDGYFFKVHRTKANWAVQWSRVVAGIPVKDARWAPTEIDATHKSIRDGGGLSRVTIARAAAGDWTFSSPDWNNGTGGSVQFNDSSTNNFSQFVLVGTKNFDEQAFNKISLSISNEPTPAIPVENFLNSIGVGTTFPDRGQPLDKTIEMVKFGGFRWVRGGIEGLTEKGPTTLQTYLDLHQATGVVFSWGLVSGGTDLKKLLETARKLDEAKALLAFEGNNEPNNWGVTYQGEKGGGQAPSWLAVARLQRDLYAAVKSDPALKKYPVWSISEGGGQTDNVGLQFLKIPEGAKTLMPAGTHYADFANVHNYIYHPASPGLADNKTWNAADPTSACKVDGLYGNYGRTWAKHFPGYSESDLIKLPRVTTETGCTIEGPITEEIHGLNLLSMYLAQFKRGWSHTAVYLLRDRTDEAGNQSFGFFTRDYKPRKAVIYLHSLTSILADKGSPAKLGQLNYTIPNQPATLHDLLLQKSDGTLMLILWNERVKGSDEVTVELGETFANVKVFNPTIGKEPVQVAKDAKAIKLTLSNHPLVLELNR